MTILDGNSFFPLLTNERLQRLCYLIMYGPDIPLHVPSFKKQGIDS